MSKLNENAKQGVEAMLEKICCLVEFLLPLGSITNHWLSYKMKGQWVLSIKETEGGKKCTCRCKHWMIR